MSLAAKRGVSIMEVEGRQGVWHIHGGKELCALELLCQYIWLS